MSENLKLNLIMVVADILITAMFTILAIVFQKWWIVLFSILLSYTINSKEDKKWVKYHITTCQQEHMQSKQG